MFVINSECRAGMAKHVADNSIDAIVTDPPYGLSKEPNMTEVLCHWLAGDDYTHGGSGFMGNTWDSFVPGPSIWKEAIRCLKPGGYALVFAGSRTQDLMATSLRLAGFEIRDTIMWVYGSGFPKSMDVSKAIDKRFGAEREIISERPAYGIGGAQTLNGHAEGATAKVSAPATDEAKAYEGYGTALKPAYEPIIVCRKPLDGTVANNVLTHGTGGINIDGCRVLDGTETGNPEPLKVSNYKNNIYGKGRGGADWENTKGRWPANIMHDGSDEVVEMFPEGKAKFFYCAKASKADRNAGLDDFRVATSGECVKRESGADGTKSPRAGAGRTSGNANIHPTVKPTELMRWMCRLVGHPGAVIMDPFTGSGSTGRGAILEGFGFIGFEMGEQFCEISNARILDAVLNRV